MMSDNRTVQYAENLSRLIQAETISKTEQPDKSVFLNFHELLKEVFPHIFAVGDLANFGGSLLLRWKGTGNGEPVLMMNHMDVVEASGEWTHPPFSGAIAEDKLWGRGTLDTKGGLWGMLQAADELAAEGFTPSRDIFFLSTCNEETGGADADQISSLFEKKGLRFSMVLDEGGMILEEPISGASGTYAMVGVGEKGCADLKFIARSSGGHASTPGKDTPLVRLGKFMAAVEKKSLFPAKISPVIHEMFSVLAPGMQQPLKTVLGHSKLFEPILLRVMPSVSATAGAMLKTTLAFTMASGSQGRNVLPQEAWIIGNMRYSHHQGRDESIAAISAFAEKFDIETEVLDAGFASPLSDCDSDAYRLVERAVTAVFPGVKTSPYIMTGATDSRYMSRVCDTCLRFSPFLIDKKQLESVHGIDENLNLSALVPAVDFYRYIITEV